MIFEDENFELKIKEDFDLERLKSYGFKTDKHSIEYIRYNPKNKNIELCVNKNTRNIYIWEYQFNYYGLTISKDSIKRIAEDLVADDLIEEINK